MDNRIDPNLEIIRVLKQMRTLFAIMTGIAAIALVEFLFPGLIRGVLSRSLFWFLFLAVLVPTGIGALMLLAVFRNKRRRTTDFQTTTPTR